MVLRPFLPFSLSGHRRCRWFGPARAKEWFGFFLGPKHDELMHFVAMHRSPERLGRGHSQLRPSARTLHGEAFLGPKSEAFGSTPSGGLLSSGGFSWAFVQGLAAWPEINAWGFLRHFSSNPSGGLLSTCGFPKNPSEPVQPKRSTCHPMTQHPVNRIQGKPHSKNAELEQPACLGFVGINDSSARSWYPIDNFDDQTEATKRVSICDLNLDWDHITDSKSGQLVMSSGNQTSSG